MLVALVLEFLGVVEFEVLSRFWDKPDTPFLIDTAAVAS
jgi:hypothetical protein